MGTATDRRPQFNKEGNDMKSTDQDGNFKNTNIGQGRWIEHSTHAYTHSCKKWKRQKRTRLTQTYLHEQEDASNNQ